MTKRKTVTAFMVGDTKILDTYLGENPKASGDDVKVTLTKHSGESIDGVTPWASATIVTE